ncbi:glycosyltransferase family 1 protein [Favolaschia claudopus]|uniref:Glycosyltransferase family 1 protein n=1 Tax=Favolaschia claudopus TaxID=2862362 RepID=A0AAW0C416_9AGAR
MSEAHHILLFPFPAYGHIRPICALAGRLAAAQDDVTITIFTSPNWLRATQNDIFAQFLEGDKTLERIRVVSLFDSSETELFVMIPQAIQHFPAAYQTLLLAAPITCATTKHTFPAVPPPSAVILDVFALAPMQAARSLSGTTIPIFTFMCGPSAAHISMFGPEAIGGRAELFGRIEDEAKRVGKPAEEVADAIWNHTEGKVISIPGVPPMYDYERNAQTALEGPVGSLLLNANKMLLESEGLLTGTTPVYDGASYAAFEGFMRDTLKKAVYDVGPLLPPAYGAMKPKGDTAPSGVEAGIAEFLDGVRNKYGERSMLFISFGTVFWPKLATQVEDLVDVLIEKEFPFFLCHASPMAVIPEPLLGKIKASGIGMTSPWAPQHSILTHPVTGWFLTHGGHGGVMEAIASGVPMICWPFEADQPIAAQHLSKNLNVAFHLIQVRTGKGLQPMYDGTTASGTREAMQAELGSVLDECRGAVGQEKRRNVGRVWGDLEKVWEEGEGGTSRRAVLRFLGDVSRKG